MNYHQPVLLNEVLKTLDIKPGQVFIDCTVGHGGHSFEIVKKGGIVYGIDQDQNNLNTATNRINHQNFHPIHDNFVNLTKIISKHHIKPNGVLLDLGLSSDQQKSLHRGFSFDDPYSLDMRLDPKKQQLTAENIVNTFSYDQLYDIFTKYAQERYSKPLILKIIAQRQREPIKNAKNLADIIQQFYKDKKIKTVLNPATKIFLALRIAVNDELVNLKSVLKQTLTLPPETIICFISFHSGEDRLIKQFIKTNSPKNIISLGRNRPSYSETKQNPLSRSATLRSYKII